MHIPFPKKLYFCILYHIKLKTEIQKNHSIVTKSIILSTSILTYIGGGRR